MQKIKKYFVKQVKIFLLILLFLGLILSGYFYLNYSREKWEIFLAKGCAFFQCGYPLGEKIFLQQAKAIYLEKMKVLADAAITSGMPNCPFNGQSGEVYLRSENCNWSDMLDKCTLTGDEHGYDCYWDVVCSWQGCDEYETSCCFYENGDFIECGVWSNGYNFGSGCYNYNDDQGEWVKTYFCKIP